MGMKRVGVKRLPDGARPWSVRVTWEERRELERVLAGLRASVVVESHVPLDPDTAEHSPLDPDKRAP